MAWFAVGIAPHAVLGARISRGIPGIHYVPQSDLMPSLLTRSPTSIQPQAFLSADSDHTPVPSPRDSSFASVANWPEVSVFTFGEVAFLSSQFGKSYSIPGARVVVQGDIMPMKLGQWFGFHHTKMLQALNLRTGKDDNKMSFSKHDLSLYTRLLKERLLRTTRGSISQRKNLQAYRMSLLAEKMSYIDTNVANVESVLKFLRRQRNPIKPRAPLYHKLEHVMTFEFFTPASVFARLVNFWARPFGLPAPIARQGIAHNVHLLKDGNNNGYLTFQGTKSLGTWFDVHLDWARYNPNTQRQPFGDDERWKSLQPQFLNKCHTGFTVTLKSFISNEHFPLLAQKAVGFKSLSVTGHSFGGSIASMLAMGVHRTKEIFRLPSERSTGKSMAGMMADALDRAKDVFHKKKFQNTGLQFSSSA